MQWNISEAWIERDKSLRKTQETTPKVVDPLKSPYVVTDCYSVHDRSHTRGVSDIKWIPNYIEMNR